MKDVFTVAEIGEVQWIDSQDGSSRKVPKRVLVLQGWGDKMADHFVCAALGRTTRMNLHPGDVIQATLTCHKFDYKGFVYQRNLMVGFTPLYVQRPTIH